MNTMRWSPTRFMAAVVLLVAGSAGSAVAQVPQDSVEAWATQLQSGPLADRMAAAGKLAELDAQALTPAARQALIDELDRVHGFLLRGEPVPDADSIEGHDVGEYYLALVVAVAGLRTRQADRALIPAVGVSDGVAKRAAQLGDEAIPLLAEMVDRGYESRSAIETLALAWFWADSTGASLSDVSRATILEKLGQMAETDTLTAGLGVAVGLRHIGDPAFLPLGRFLEERAVRENLYFLGIVRGWTIPALEAVVASTDVTGLAEASARLTAALCVDARPSPRQGACTALRNQYETALEHLRAGRARPARTALQAIVQRAQEAARIGAISEAELALIGGGARQVLDAL